MYLCHSKSLKSLTIIIIFVYTIQNSSSYLDAKEIVGNFQNNISDHAKTHLQLSKIIWKLFLEHSKIRISRGTKFLN